MAFWDWLTGNNTEKRNNVKIAEVKKELQFMTREQRINKLRKLKSNGYYPFDKANAISDIYGCDYELTTDFLIYYLLFMNDDIRNEVEVDVDIVDPNAVSLEEVDGLIIGKEKSPVVNCQFVLFVFPELSCP